MKKVLWVLRMKLDVWYYFGSGDDTIAGYVTKRGAQHLADSWAEGWQVHRFVLVSEATPAGEHTVYMACDTEGNPIRRTPRSTPTLVSSLENLESEKLRAVTNWVQYTLWPCSSVDRASGS